MARTSDSLWALEVMKVRVWGRVTGGGGACGVGGDMVVEGCKGGDWDGDGDGNGETEMEGWGLFFVRVVGYV